MKRDILINDNENGFDIGILIHLRGSVEDSQSTIQIGESEDYIISAIVTKEKSGIITRLNIDFTNKLRIQSLEKK